MTIWQYSGIVDKVLLVISIYIALFLYYASFRNHTGRSKARIPVFCLSVIGNLGLCFLCEYLKVYIGTNETVILMYKNSCNALFIVVAIAGMCILQKFSFKTVLFIGCAALASANCGNHLYSLICSLFFGPKYERIAMTAEIALRMGIFILSYAVMYTFCWFVLIKKYRTNGKEYTINSWGYLLFIMCFVVNFFLGTYDNVNDLPVRLQFIAKILMNLLILFFLFYQSKYLNLQEENMRLQFIMDQQKQQFNVTKECIDQINVKAHDIKHIINILKEDKGTSDEFVSQLTDIYNNYENIYKTGNDALDITLNEKCKDFARNGIAVSIIADGSALSFMSDIDIYILFGNLIDNAKEAVMQIGDSNNRIFGLYLKKADGVVSLHSENTYERTPLFCGGIPQTVKSDKANHGYGVKSMKMITEKYGGMLKMSCDDKLFKVDIAFFMN